MSNCYSWPHGARAFVASILSLQEFSGFYCLRCWGCQLLPFLYGNGKLVFFLRMACLKYFVFISRMADEYLAFVAWRLHSFLSAIGNDKLKYLSLSPSLFAFLSSPSLSHLTPPYLVFEHDGCPCLSAIENDKLKYLYLSPPLSLISLSLISPLHVLLLSMAAVLVFLRLKTIKLKYSSLFPSLSLPNSLLPSHPPRSPISPPHRAANHSVHRNGLGAHPHLADVPQQILLDSNVGQIFHQHLHYFGSFLFQRDPIFSRTSSSRVHSPEFNVTVDVTFSLNIYCQIG